MTTLSNAKLDEVLAVLTNEASIWVSLHSADPGKTGASELTIVSRAEITSAEWNAAVSSGADRLADNSIELDFGAATGSGTANYYGFWDDDRGEIGEAFLGGSDALPVPQTITIGNPVKALVGALDIIAESD